MGRKKVEEVVVVDNRIRVSTYNLIQEALAYLKSQTGVAVDSYNLYGDEVELVLDGNQENLTVFKDRIGVKEDTKAISNSQVNKIKASINKLIKDNFEEDYTLKLRAMDVTPDIIFLNLTLVLSTIPYPITITYKIYSEGEVGIGYIIFGDATKEERWSASSVKAETLISKLKEIKEYYNTKNTLPEE